MTLFVIDPNNSFRTLEIRGDASFEDASFEEDPGLVVFDQTVEAYGQDPVGFPAPRDNRVVLRLTPSRVVAVG